MNKGLSLIVMLSVAACGATDSNDEIAVNSYSVVSAADLPACDTDRLGQLYYLETENEFRTCKTTGWSVIAIRGEDGTDGVDGEDGMTIASGFNCNKIVSSRFYVYHSVVFSTGDRFVACSGQDSYGTYSDNLFYKATQPGATNAGCTVGFDVDTATAGFWNFAINSGVKTATYSDTGSASNGTVITFNSGDCTNF